MSMIRVIIIVRKLETALTNVGQISIQLSDR